jgi:hypothetical protein
VGVDERSVTLQYAGLQPTGNEPQKRLVVDALAQHLEQPIMVEAVEKAFDVGFYYVPVAAELQLVGEVFDRLLSPHSRAVAVAQGQEVVLVDGFEQQSDGPLQKPVFHDRNTIRTLPTYPSRLRDS